MLPSTSTTSQDLAPTTDLPQERHPALVYLARLAAGSRRSMTQALETIAALLTGGACTLLTMPWYLLRYQHAAALQAKLGETYAPATANKMLAALRGVLREAWNLQLIDGESFQRAAAVKSIRAITLPRGRALTAGEVRALFEDCQQDNSAAGARDAAVLALLYGGGLRRAEVVGLDVSDYDTASGALRIRAGKGRKDRIAYATNGARSAIELWLRARGAAAGPLVTATYHDTIRHGRLTAQAVLYLVRRRAERAGVKRFSPHDLRRTFVGDLLESGADINTVKELAGHSSVATTARYDRRGEATKQRAASMLHVPFRG